MIDISIVGLFARLLVALAVVFGLMWVAGRLMRGRMPMAGGRSARPVAIEVLGRQGLGRTASITLVRTSGKVLVLGVTETSINVLAEVDPDTYDFDGPESDRTSLSGGGPVVGPGKTWRAMLDTARERTTRRS